MWTLNNSLNQFPIDRHLGCSQPFAVTNCAAAHNLVLTSFLPCVSVFARQSPPSSRVGSKSMHGGIFTDTARLPSTEVVLMYAPSEQHTRVKAELQLHIVGWRGGRRRHGDGTLQVNALPKRTLRRNILVGAQKLVWRRQRLDSGQRMSAACSNAGETRKGFGLSGAREIQGTAETRH